MINTRTVSLLAIATAAALGTMLGGCASTAPDEPMPVWSGSGEPGRIIGIGGVFFRTDDQAATKAWYAETLGMPSNGPTYGLLFWRDAETGTVASTTWGTFTRDSDYFDADQTHMVNYIVDDLDAARARLQAAGARVDEKIEDTVLGRIGWIWDPDGNKAELWEPDVEFIRDGYAMMRDAAAEQAP